ncbi:MAG: Co2+/Mg2+ efflux protein ApaG, partial [Thermoanaerobaculia bacterium]
MSDATTRGIRVQVQSFYDEERSSPQESYYFFVYHVRISNHGTATAQLVSREWFITDANGETQRVQGPGVVGERPVLAPGDSFEYTSFCPLTTPVGSMCGT